MTDTTETDKETFSHKLHKALDEVTENKETTGLRPCFSKEKSFENWINIQISKFTNKSLDYETIELDRLDIEELKHLYDSEIKEKQLEINQLKSSCQYKELKEKDKEIEKLNKRVLDTALEFQKNPLKMKELLIINGELQAEIEHEKETSCLALLGCNETITKLQNLLSDKYKIMARDEGVTGLLNQIIELQAKNEKLKKELTYKTEKLEKHYNE